MIGGVTRPDGFPGLLSRVTLSAGITICHVNVSKWGDRLAKVASCCLKMMFLIYELSIHVNNFINVKHRHGSLFKKKKKRVCISEMVDYAFNIGT